MPSKSHRIYTPSLSLSLSLSWHWQWHWSLCVLYVLLLHNHTHYVLSQPCPNDCSARGRCIYPGQTCQCFEGFRGGDCSERECPRGNAWVDVPLGVDNAHNLVECSNKGVCNRATGVCSCDQNFEGIACERKSCPNQCNAHGQCQSMQYYAMNRDPGEITHATIQDYSLYAYDSIWDSNKMFGCNCDAHYHGHDCSLRKCPTGDDPLTGVGVSQPLLGNPNQLNDIQKVVCKAASGTFTLSFRGATSKPIPFNANQALLSSMIQAIPTIGAGAINLILQATTQACTPDSSSWTVEFTQQFGNLPRLVPNATGLVFNTAAFTPFVTVAIQQVGTREDLDCAGRGICDTTTGVCGCSQNFMTSNGLVNNGALGPGSRGDCGYYTAQIQVCPGDVLSCSAHGKCNSGAVRTYNCICNDGWTGADCSLRTCPTGVAWFTYPSADNVAHLYESVECSDMGTCDRALGICNCAPGYTGTACEFMSCPGTLTPCNGKGVCLDMATLASTFDQVYGSLPNNPATWDANKIMGCLCDYPYTGYDCSLMECPTGDDPQTIGQFDEVQQITCVDADATGTVILKLGRFISSSTLTPLSTASDIQAAINSIPFAGRVTVVPLSGISTDSFCSVSGNSFLVTFLTNHGDLPLLQEYQNNGLGSITVVEAVKGTKENIPCSGRGLCQPNTGICECFDGFASSDGMGGIGELRDCGYANPITA